MGAEQVEGPLAVLRSRAQTLEAERVRLEGALEQTMLRPLPSLLSWLLPAVIALVAAVPVVRAGHPLVALAGVGFWALAVGSGVALELFARRRHSQLERAAGQAMASPEAQSPEGVEVTERLRELEFKLLDLRRQLAQARGAMLRDERAGGLQPEDQTPEWERVSNPAPLLLLAAAVAAWGLTWLLLALSPRGVEPWVGLVPGLVASALHLRLAVGRRR